MQRLEAEKKREQYSSTKRLPTLSGATSSDKWLREFPDLYGYRGQHDNNPGLFLLSPWEFLMHWEVKELPKPPAGKTHGPLSQWVDVHDKDNEEFEPVPNAETRTFVLLPKEERFCVCRRPP